MATFQVKTKNVILTDKKPRVYFTCHPEDFKRYFHKICEDIFKTHDCAIYYTEDMTQAIAEEDKETDLGRSHLFVVPVTYKLLTTPNRAMAEDIPYAREAHIPILPILMEAGIDAFYAQPDAFGELQYLNPYSTDLTEISYEEKLKKYLESVLISDEMAARIRAAFDTYIFLSYRKKDRKYANQLMRLIHSHPECRDIAVWFDEFLTPGESFTESIARILKDSQLFALLVTPNLLEEPNYVMEREYPEARKAGIPILPAEMEPTDPDALRQKFEALPACLPPEGEAFHALFLESVSRIIAQADRSPEHDYLIGLAYLKGIDMEVNHEFALDRITKAAQAGLPEAMVRLYDMYTNGIATSVNYGKAIEWAEKVYDYACQSMGEEDPQTLLALKNLIFLYGELGDYDKSLALAEKTYRLRRKVLGEEHQETLLSLTNLATAYGKCGDPQKELELTQQAYRLQVKVLGQEHPDTLMSINNLALIYSHLGQEKKALKMQEQAYRLHLAIRGEDNINTLITLSNLACAYDHAGQHDKALKLNEQVYRLYSEKFGEQHPETLTSLSNLALTHRNLKHYKKAVELNERVYQQRCRILGEDHPYTLLSLDNLAVANGENGDRQKALRQSRIAHERYVKTLGEEHPYTLVALSNLAYAYHDYGNVKKALELRQRAYELFCRHFGQAHPNTLTVLSNLIQSYIANGNTKKARELKDRLDQLQDN